MTRILLSVLLLIAMPALSQEAAPAEEPEPADIVVEVVPEGAQDPAAAWEADRTAVLPAEGVDLDAFEYLARPLVIFGDSPRQPQVEEQLRLIRAEMATLAARDVAVIVDTDPAARSDVRRALRPRGFGIVLLDKDGRVTLRRPAPLSVREIARAIDRSPIRQEELRNARDPAG